MRGPVQSKWHAAAPFEPRCYGLEPKWLRKDDNDNDNDNDNDHDHDHDNDSDIDNDNGNDIVVEYSIDARPVR